MTLGIAPKVGYEFKRLFGVDRNAALLIDLLNAILDLPEHRRIRIIQHSLGKPAGAE